MQIDDAVVGTGVLRDGIETQVSAAGTLLGKNLALFVIPKGGQTLYRFSLDIKSGSMDGNYIYSEQGMTTKTGVAFAQLIAPKMATSGMKNDSLTMRANPKNDIF